MKKKCLIILLTIVNFSLVFSQSENINEKALEIITAFEIQIDKDIEQDNINGAITAAIVKDNELIWSKGYGTVDPNSDLLANSNTIFRIGSITKSFTSFLMMQLYQEGLIDLDDPIEKFLPEIRNLKGYSDSTKITFNQLASHTSGLNREANYREANEGTLSEWESKVLLAIPQTSFRNQPGERFRYSNIGYAILGLALSKVDERSYIELVQEKIFNPLGMESSYFKVPNENTKQLATGMAGGPMTDLNLELPRMEHEGRGYRVPNGSIYSTTSDLTKFMIAMMGYHELLTRESLNAMTTTQTPTTRMRQNYGYGFDLYKDDIIKTVGHAGSTPGYSAHLEFEEESGFGVVILRNYNFGNTNLDLRVNALLRDLKKSTL